MKRWILWPLVGATSLVVLAAAVALTGNLLAQRKMARRVEVKVNAVPLPVDSAGLARGRYLFETRGCTECHATNGAGRTFINDGTFRVAGPQVAPGSNSAVTAYRIEDWVRTIRHGVDPAGRALLVMPSEDFNRWSDDNLGALIAYLQSMPAVDGHPRTLDLPLPMRVLYGFGLIQDAAEKIDHELASQAAIAVGANANYGRYVANMCIGCHGPGLSGGKVPGGPPDWPATANLTPGTGSVMPRYPDLATFTAMLRSGKRPDGSSIAVMPFEALAKLDGTEVEAVYAFLRTVPPRAAGNR